MGSKYFGHRLLDVDGIVDVSSNTDLTHSDRLKELICGGIISAPNPEVKTTLKCVISSCVIEVAA